MDFRNIIQTKRFCRIHKKYPVSLEFLQANTVNILNFLKYTVSLHVVLKRKLNITAERRVFIKWNILRKNLFSNRGKKRKRLLPWSKQIILYLRKNYKLEKLKVLNALADYHSDSTNDSYEKTDLNPEEIQAKLKAQLLLLNNNKKSIPLLGGDIAQQPVTKTSNISELSKTIFSRTNSFGGFSNNIYASASSKELRNEIATNTQSSINKLMNVQTDVEHISSNKETSRNISLSKEKIDVPVDENSNEKGVITNNSKKSFLDSLMNKICITPINETECDKTSNFQKTFDYDNDSDTGDFFKGFSASDIENHPSLLPTPIVPQENITENAAFLSSEDLDKFFKDNSLKESPIKLPILKKVEQGMISKNSVPPKFSKPAREINLIKPRTVAEKRLILQKGRNYKYLMIENENTIYRELKRRSKGSRPMNLQLIRHIQELKVPFSRDLWKAMSWLSTETNNYYFQNIVIDKREVKLIGGPGNYKTKYLPDVVSFLKEEVNCTKACKDKQIFPLIRVRHKLIPKPKDEQRLMSTKTLNVANKFNKMRKLPIFKPGPLSSKCNQMKQYFEPKCGTDLYTLPDIQLEVFPKINHPLDDYIKGYLKLILPSKHISREWAEFSVSTLIENQNENKDTINSFTFTIPYQNNEKKILVRRLLNRKEIYDNSVELQFRKNVDFNNKLEVECADMLSGMIESVALSLGEDSLIKDDPNLSPENMINVHENTCKKENIIIETKHKLKNTSDEPPLKKLKKTNPKTRLLSELKRLNATIIDAAVGSVPQVEVKCSYDYCRLGCICTSLNNTNIVRNHCQKSDCIFNCTCVISSIDQDPSQITSENALILRQKATARLAKMEREFTSTVVLTNNETVLINESQLERKRRCTQRFLNYSQDNSDDEKPKHSSRKKRFISSTHTKSPIKEAKVPALEDITYVSEDTFKMLKHSSLELINLELKKYQKWCMVHCLYNCFCKCRDTEGKPFILKKENIPPEQENIVISRKAKYSFDKHEKINVEEIVPEEEPKSISEKDNIKKKSLETEKFENNLKVKICDKNEIIADLSEEKCERKKRNKKKKKNKQLFIQEMSEKMDKIRIKNVDEINNKSDLKAKSDCNNQLLEKEVIILDKYTKQDSDVICRRVIRIPQVYKWRNKRPEHVAKRHIYEENSSSNFILRNKIKKSEQYRPLRPAKSTSQISLIQPEIFQKNPTIEYPNNGLFKSKINNANDVSNNLRISSVVSLGAQKLPTHHEKSNHIIIADVNCGVKNNQSADYNTNLLKTSPDITIPHNISTRAKSKCDNILNVLNFAVTKTMHNICQIQLKETKHIPTPVLDQLFISQWRNFLQAYKEGIIHVWEVKVENCTYFTATMEFIPLIRNAFSVINIKAIPQDKLPLFGKLLSSQFTNSNCSSLSVLMCGREDHWRIIGMTKASIDYVAQGGVIKPTPQSHPWLSKKINKLYEYMARQHFSNFGKVTPDQKQAHLKDLAILKEKLKMNVSIRKLSEQDIQRENLVIPLSSEKGDHKWLILDIGNDFSHILFLNAATWLSFNKIKIAFQKSHQENKMVRLPKVDGDSLDCYITKNNKNRIYLGPYPVNKEPEIVLCQCVNGKMLIREHYENKYKKISSERTNGFWLCFKNGKVMYDLNVNSYSSDLNNGFKSTIVENKKDMTSISNQNQLLNGFLSKSVVNQSFNATIPNTKTGFQNSLVTIGGKNLLDTNLKLNPTTMLPVNHDNSGVISVTNDNYINNTINSGTNITPSEEVHNIEDINFFQINSASSLQKFQQSKILNIANNKLTQMEPGNYEIINKNTLSQEGNVFPTNIIKSSINNNNNSTSLNSSTTMPNLLKNPILIPNHDYITMKQNTKTNNVHNNLSQIESSHITPINSTGEINSINNKTSIISNTNLSNSNNTNMPDNSKSAHYTKIKETETCTNLANNPLNFGKMKVLNKNNFINTKSCAIELPSDMQNKNQINCNVNINHEHLTNDAKNLKDNFGITFTDNTNFEDEIFHQNIDIANSSLDPLKIDSSFKNDNAGSKLQNNFGMVVMDGLKCETKVSSQSTSCKRNTNCTKSSKSTFEAVHGYFFSDPPQYPKFGGVHRNSQYLIRVNRDSSLKFNNLIEVSEYLNQHIIKHNSVLYKPEFAKIPWKFKPIVRPNNMEALSRAHTAIQRKIVDVNDAIDGSKTKEKNVKPAINQTNNIIVIDD